MHEKSGCQLLHWDGSSVDQTPFIFLLLHPQGCKLAARAPALLSTFQIQSREGEEEGIIGHTLPGESAPLRGLCYGNLSDLHIQLIGIPAAMEAGKYHLLSGIDSWG